MASLLGALLGTGIYYLPTKYLVSGSFYVTRTPQETSPEYFTYEGYYSQQTSIAYTNTVIALLESIDTRKEVLESQSQATSEKNLRKLARDTKVTKSGPQIITLTVKRNSPHSAENYWNSYAETLLNTVMEKNQNGDRELQVLKVAEKPVTAPVYKSLPIDIIVGSFVMLACSAGYASLKEYNGKGRKK